MNRCYVCGERMDRMINDRSGWCRVCDNLRMAAPSEDEIRAACMKMKQGWSKRLESVHRIGYCDEPPYTVPAVSWVTDHMVRRNQVDA